MHRIKPEEVERYKNATYKIGIGNFKEGIIDEQTCTNQIKDNPTRYHQKNVMTFPITEPTQIDFITLRMADKDSDEYRQINERIVPSLWADDYDNIVVTFSLIIEELSGGAILIE